MSAHTLLRPGGLWLLTALGALIVLYVLKPRRNPVSVSSIWLWQAAHRELSAEKPFRRLRLQLPLLLEAAALGLFAFALARPGTRSRALPSDHLAIVVDTTASMQAADVEAGTPPGTTRMDRAKKTALAVLSSLPPGAEAVLVEAGHEARVASPLDADRHTEERVLRAMTATDAEGDLESAVFLAVDRLRQTTGTRRVVVVTDQDAPPNPSARAASVPIEYIRVGQDQDNTGIVRCDVRSGTDPTTRIDQVQVFAMLENFGEKSREVYVTLREENASDVLASRRILVEPGKGSSVVLTFAPAPGDIGRGLVIDASPHDLFPADDVAYARVPAGARLPTVYARNPALDATTPRWLERALVSDPAVELTRAAPDDVATLAGDVSALTVTEGFCPNAMPSADLLVVAPPAGACAGLRVAPPLPHPVITSWARADARMRFVALGDIHLGNASTFDARDDAALIRSQEGIIAADASTPAQTVTLVGAELGSSDWPQSASFVLFVRNVAELARTHRARGIAHPAKVGEVVTLGLPSSVLSARVEGPMDKAEDVPVHDGVAVLANVKKAGLYHVSWQGPRASSAVFAANLSSERESDLRPRAHPALGGKDVRESPASAADVAEKARALPDAYHEYAWVLAFVALIAIVFDVAWLTRGRPLMRPSLVAILLAVLFSIVPLVWFALGSTAYTWTNLLRIGRPYGAFAGILALPYIAVRLFPRDQKDRRGPAQRRPVAIFTSVAALLCAWTIAGIDLGAAKDRLSVLVALDRSRSIDLVPDAEVRVTRDLAVAERSMKKDDAIGTVVFAAEAATEDPLRPRSNLPPAARVEIGRDGTDIASAIERALAEAPSEGATRIALVTDGVATRGNAEAAATAAAAHEVPIDVVPLDQRTVHDVRVRALTAPEHADEGEPMGLLLVTTSSVPTEVEVRLSVDGALVSRARAKIAAGEDVLRLTEVAPSAGLHRFDAEVTALDAGADLAPDDNGASAFVRVRGAASALVLEGEPGKSAFLARALEHAAFRVREGGTTAVPADIGELAAYDLVVLSDIAAGECSPQALQALATYTRDLGGGLLLMGGEKSMGPGGYAKTPIEEVSPVSFDLKQERRRASLAEVIAIDYSGSMGATVPHGETKLALANEAAARSAALLGPGDRLGVVHVDTNASWTVPLGPLTDPAAIDHRIRAVPLGGGGIYVDLALREGYAALAKETVSLKHMLLFADGDDAERMSGCRATVSTALAHGITTSVVALGRGHDSPELETLSKLGSGRFYLVEDASRLPAVFAQETVLAARSAIHETDFKVDTGAPSAITRGIAFSEAPQLRGYVITIAKPRASVLLSGPEGDPILATWSAGLGHAAAFTSDLRDRWGAAWTSWPGAARLVGQLGRQLARKDDDPRVRLSSKMVLGEMKITAEVRGDDGRAETFRRLSAEVAGPDGFLRRVSLEPVGAGSYAASLPLSRPGAYVATTKDEASNEAVGTTAAVLTSGDELRPTGTDRGLLERIAKITGGRVRDNLAGLFDDRPPPKFVYSPLSPYLVVAAALALLLAVAARRLALPKVVASWPSRARRRDVTRPERSRTRGAPAVAGAASPPPEARPVGATRIAPEPAADDAVAVPAGVAGTGTEAPPPGKQARALTAAEILVQRRRNRF